MAQCCVPCGKLTAWHGKAPTTRCHNTPIKCKTSCVCVGCQKHSLVCVVLACSAAPSALLVSPPSCQSVGHVDGWLCVLMHTHHQPPNTLVPHNTHAPWACSHTPHTNPTTPCVLSCCCCSAMAPTVAGLLCMGKGQGVVGHQSPNTTFTPQQPCSTHGVVVVMTSVTCCLFHTTTTTTTHQCIHTCW